MMYRVAVIGLGKAGLPIASIVADNELKVIGVDIDKSRCNFINAGMIPIQDEVGLDELIKTHGGKKFNCNVRL